MRAPTLRADAGRAGKPGRRRGRRAPARGETRVSSAEPSRLDLEVEAAAGWSAGREIIINTSNVFEEHASLAVSVTPTKGRRAGPASSMHDARFSKPPRPRSCCLASYDARGGNTTVSGHVCTVQLYSGRDHAGLRDLFSLSSRPRPSVSCVGFRVAWL